MIHQNLSQSLLSLPSVKHGDPGVGSTRYWTRLQPRVRYGSDNRFRGQFGPGTVPQRRDLGPGRERKSANLPKSIPISPYLSPRVGTVIQGWEPLGIGLRYRPGHVPAETSVSGGSSALELSPRAGILAHRLSIPIFAIG